MTPRLACLLPCVLFAACAGSTEYRTVKVNTPQGTYDEKVGVTPPPPAHAPDGGPYVPPTFERRPVTVYTPNGGASTVDVQQEK